MSQQETYPYPDDGIINDAPIKPLLQIDCEDTPDWRSADLWHALCPDLWINKACWVALDPETPYEELPKMAKT